MSLFGLLNIGHRFYRSTGMQYGATKTNHLGRFDIGVPAAVDRETVVISVQNSS